MELPRTDRIGVCDAISFGVKLLCCFACCVDRLPPPSPDDNLPLSVKTDRQYEPTPVKSTTVSLTTAPKLTSGRYFTPILSIIERRYADVAQSCPVAVNERESDADGRNDVDSAK